MKLARKKRKSTGGAAGSGSTDPLAGQLFFLSLHV